MHPVFLIILSLFVLLYCLQTAFIYVGTFRLNYTRSEAVPSISVLVALRNEAANLAHCVDSLLALDYPVERTEIVLINDRSRDETATLIEAFRKKSPLVKTVHISGGLGGLSGKANAIAHGIRHCTHEIILVTDGDCKVPASWAKAHVSYYKKNVGLVGGFTLLDRYEKSASLWGRIQSLDWAYLLSVGTGAMGFGLPLSVLGNNFSFRRKAYEEVGGYEEMGFTIIEDFALMKYLLSRTEWQVRYPIDHRMLVYSLPMKNLTAFYHQRKRWAAGGKEIGFYGKSLMSISFVSHIVVPGAFLLADQVFQVALFLVALLVCDFFLLQRTTRLVKRGDLLKTFLLWEVFYYCYTTFFAPVLLFPTTVVWKDVSYSWKFGWRIKNMRVKNRS